MNLSGGRVIAQLGDLYPRWLGARALLMYGQNPYGPEVSHQIQMAFYGHPVIQDLGQPGHTPVDEQRFAYPVFVVFLLAPTIHVPFPSLQSGAAILLVLLTAAGTFLWLDFLRWRHSELTVAITLFVLASPQIIQGLRFRQLALLVGFLVACAAWCVSKNHLATAGILLAITTIKPQMVLLALPWFLLWAFSKWRKRWRLLAGFTGMFAALVVAGELLLPGWTGYFFQGIAAYRKYFPTMSWFEAVLGYRLGTVCAVIAIVILLAFAWKNRKQPGESQEFAVTLAAVFLVTALAIPLLQPFNQVILILPAFLLLRDWQTLPAWARVAFALCVAWPGVGSLALFVFSSHIHAPSRLVLLPSFVCPVVPFVFPALFIIWYSRTTKVPATSPLTPV